MIKQTQSLFFLIFFVSINLFGRVLPNDVVWNESETGYFTIKDNNIVLVSTRGKEDKVILSSSQVNNLEIESFSFSQSKNKILIFLKFRTNAIIFCLNSHLTQFSFHHVGTTIFLLKYFHVLRWKYLYNVRFFKLR